MQQYRLESTTHRKEKDGRILSPRERALATPVDIIFREDNRGKPKLYETKLDKRVSVHPAGNNYIDT